MESQSGDDEVKEKKKAGRKKKRNPGTPKNETNGQERHPNMRQKEINRRKRERRKSREAGNCDGVEQCDEGDEDINMLTEEDEGPGQSSS